MPQLKVGLVLALAACATLPAKAPEPSLRVMSYNIEYGHEGLDNVAKVIRDQHPDIVGLQEVDVHWSARSNFVDQAAALSKATGMDYRFARIYQLPNADPSKPPREFGVALLSRYPIVAFTNHEITRHSTQDSTAAPAPMPGLLEAKVNVNGRMFRVFDVHLDYRSDPTVRIQQVKEMRAYMGTDTIPTILTGDLNASPDASELHGLLLSMTDVLGEEGKSEFTYSSSKPEKRIDYILTSEICTISAHVVKAYASDHFPVVADVSSTKWCVDLRHGIK